MRCRQIIVYNLLQPGDGNGLRAFKGRFLASLVKLIVKCRDFALHDSVCSIFVTYGQNLHTGNVTLIFYSCILWYKTYFCILSAPYVVHNYSRIISIKKSQWQKIYIGRQSDHKYSKTVSDTIDDSQVLLDVTF